MARLLRLALTELLAEERETAELPAEEERETAELPEEVELAVLAEGEDGLMAVLVEEDEGVVDVVEEVEELEGERRSRRRERRREPRPSGWSATTSPLGRTVPAGSMSCHFDAKSARVVMLGSQGSVSG